MLRCYPNVRRTTGFFTAVILVFFLIPVLFGFSSTSPLSRELSDHAFGIGFDLTPSYGTAAVSYPNGSILSIAKVQGDATYKEMMSRLAQKSSQHLHQPYTDMGEYLQDLPRRLLRNSRKRLGLPASADVGTLSEIIKLLHAEAETFVGRRISTATISIPKLSALYGEDLLDAFDYLKLSYINLPYIQYWGPKAIHSSNAVYAGNGRGLCTNYTVPAMCEEQIKHLPPSYLLAVSYTHTSLIASQVYADDAYFLEEFPTIVELTLGYDARHDSPNEDLYWEMVRDTLSLPILSSYVPRNVTKVLLSGDAAHEPKFLQILEVVTDRVMDVVEEVIDADPIYSAAKGVAEFAKREIFARNLRSNHIEVELDLK